MKKRHSSDILFLVDERNYVHEERYLTVIVRRNILLLQCVIIFYTGVKTAQNKPECQPTRIVVCIYYQNPEQNKLKYLANTGT